jgi:hypothetical protein
LRSSPDSKGSAPASSSYKHHAQRVDVGARVDVVVVRGGLLRAHVLGRADDLAHLGEHRHLGQALRGGLGHAEVDDLGHRAPIHFRDEDVRRLEVAVDDGLLVRVLHALADAGEQLEPVARGELAPVAVVGDGLALDILHHEVGAAAVGGAGVEDLRDAGMVHQRQRLALGVEARDDRARVHALLDDLQRDAPPANGLGLLGLVDVAHAARADAPHQAVGADRHPIPIRHRQCRRPRPKCRGGWAPRNRCEFTIDHFALCVGPVMHGQHVVYRRQREWWRVRQDHAGVTEMAVGVRDQAAEQIAQLQVSCCAGIQPAKPVQSVGEIGPGAATMSEERGITGRKRDESTSSKRRRAIESLRLQEGATFDEQQFAA